MPPQVPKYRDAGAPVVAQPPIQIPDTKSKDVNKKTDSPKQDPETAAKNAEAAKQHAAGRKQQNVADEQMVRNKLDQKMRDPWGSVEEAIIQWRQKKIEKKMNEME